jgi:hypothetical protein
MYIICLAHGLTKLGGKLKGQLLTGASAFSRQYDLVEMKSSLINPQSNLLCKYYIEKHVGSNSDLNLK